MRCAVEVAPLRAEPTDDAEQVTQALLGEPLRVVESRAGWAQVVTAYDYPGWVRVDAIEEGDGRLVHDAIAEAPIDVARKYLGSPYLWGGMSVAGIDCSGLVHMSFRRTGRLVPRDADQQEDAGHVVDEPEVGDLISYGDPAGSADHIAFWAGDGRIVHSTGRDDLGVVEEREPQQLRGRRRRTFNL